MKRDLISEIQRRTGLKENGLRVTLSRLKKRRDLRTIEQAACFYIKKKKIDINVSSIIDDVTRAVLQNQGITLSVRKNPSQGLHAKPRKVQLPRIKWLGERYYTLANRLDNFYGYLFLFENALRLKIHSVMESDSPNWWETKIKTELYDVYKRASDEKSKQDKLPMVGQSQILQPYDYVTLGDLEQIIIKYHPLFVPSVFPTIHFFTGHMVIIKRVRNAIAHTTPSTTVRDIRNARNEIDILLQHFSTL